MPDSVNQPDLLPPSDAQDVDDIWGLEHVRKLAGMYLWTDDRGLRAMSEYVLESMVNEYLAGFGSDIQITLHADNSISLQDNGRGISLALDSPHPLTYVELLFTSQIHGRGYGYRDKQRYRFNASIDHLALISPFSERLTAEIAQGGRLYSATFSRGKLTERLKDIGTAPHTGTTLTYLPDSDIFVCPVRHCFDSLAKRLQQLAFLHPGLTLGIVDERESAIASPTSQRRFQYPGGLVEYVREMTSGDIALHAEPITFSGLMEQIDFECALFFTGPHLSNIDFFCNDSHNRDGGTHSNGFTKGLIQAFRRYTVANNLLPDKSDKFSSEDLLTGIVGVVTVRHPHPMFENVTLTRLLSPDAESVTRRIVYKGFLQFLKANQQIARSIFENVKTAARARTTLSQCLKARPKKRPEIPSRPTII